MAETQKLNGRTGVKVPEFLREPLEAAQARLEQFEEEAQRVLRDLMDKGRASRKDIEQMVQRLSKQDWTFPEMKQRIEKLREQGVERAAEWRGQGRDVPGRGDGAGGRSAGPGDRVPRRRDPRAGGGAVEGARPPREADRRRASKARRTKRGEAVRWRLTMADIQEMFKEAWSQRARRRERRRAGGGEGARQARRRRRVLARRREAPRARVRRAAHRASAARSRRPSTTRCGAPRAGSASRRRRTSTRCRSGWTRSPRASRRSRRSERTRLMRSARAEGRSRGPRSPPPRSAPRWRRRRRSARRPRPLAARRGREAWRAPGCEPGPPGWSSGSTPSSACACRSSRTATARRLARTHRRSRPRRRRIDPLLVLALIEVESALRPGRRSPSRGARGLMQLREPTLRREVERARARVGRTRTIPSSNVQAGIRYLRRLLDAFGREEVALMAYNAGPNRILGYLREGEIPERFHVYPRRVDGRAPPPAPEPRAQARAPGGRAAPSRAPVPVARPRPRAPRAGLRYNAPHAGHRDLLQHPGRGHPRRAALRLRPLHRLRPALRLLRHRLRLPRRARDDARRDPRRGGAPPVALRPPHRRRADAADGAPRARATSCSARGYEVAVETHGQRPLDALPPAAIRIVDVKTPGSGEPTTDFAYLDRLMPHDEVKFVVCSEEDFRWSEAVVRRHRLEGRRRTSSSRRRGGRSSRRTSRAGCSRAGLDARLSLQIHKVVWGADARGV